MAEFDDIFGPSSSLGLVAPGQQQAEGSPLAQIQQAPLAAPSQSDLGSATRANTSGAIKRPGFSDLWSYAFGGPGLVEDARNRILNERAIPVENRLRAVGEKALREGDLDTADQVANGFAQLAGQAPQYAKQAESYLNRVSKKREDIDANKALLNTAADFVADDPKAQRLLGAMGTRIGSISPEMLMKSIERLMPEIKDHDNYVTVVNAVTGRAEQKATKSMLSLEKLPPLQQKGMALLQLPPEAQAKYVDAFNALQSGKGTMEHAQIVGNLGPQIAQAAQHALQFEVMPPSAGIEKGMNYGQNSNMGGVLGLNQYGAPSPQSPTGAAPAQVPSQQPQQQPQLPQQQGRLKMAPLPPQMPMQPQQQGGVSPQTYQPSVADLDGMIKGLKAPGPGAGPEEFANYEIAKKELLKFREEAAQLEAKRSGEALNQVHKAWYLDQNYQPRQYRGKRLTAEQATQSGLYIADDPKEGKWLEDYSGNFNQVEKAKQYLDSADRKIVESVINKIVSSGGQFLSVGPSGKWQIGFQGAGAQALTPAENAVFSKMATAALAIERLINPTGQDNAKLAQAKDALTGALTSKEKMSTVLGSFLEEAQSLLQGRMETASGANPSRAKPRQFNPPLDQISNQGGVTQNIDKANRELGENSKTLMDAIKTNSGPIIAKAGENFLKSAEEAKGLGLQAVQNFMANLPDVGGAVTALNEKFKAFVQRMEGKQPEATEATSPRRVPKPNNTTGPINKETEKKLLGTFKVTPDRWK